MGLLATELLAVNNARDAEQDAKARGTRCEMRCVCTTRCSHVVLPHSPWSQVGKRTLAVRWGIGFARVEVACLAVATYALGCLLWPRLGAPLAARWPLAAAPLSALLVRRMGTQHSFTRS